MDDVLDRLWEVCDGDGAAASRPSTAMATEAQHLWKTLETLIATQKAHELRVHDAAFSKLLACVHAVVKAPHAWTPTEATSSSIPLGKGVFELVNRVLAKIGCRGEEERDAVLHAGYTGRLVLSLHSDASPKLTANESASVLHVFQTLAFDTKHRLEIVKCDAVPAALAAMRLYARELNVQLCGFKFLQFMAYEESAKEQIIEHHGIPVILDALDWFVTDTQLATSAADVLYFLSLDLETALAQQETKFVATMEAIVAHVVALMKRHPQIQQIQAHGIAVLVTFVGAHASARLYLIAHATRTTLWEIAAGALDANEDATVDAIELLEVILETPECFERLQTSVTAVHTPQDATEQMRTLHSLSALKSRLEIKRNRPQFAGKTRAIAFIVDRMQALVDCARSTQPSPSPARRSARADSTVSDDEIRLHVAPHDSSNRSCDNARHERLTADGDSDGDDSQRFLDQVSPPKRSASPYGYFDEFVRDTMEPTVQSSETERPSEYRRDTAHTRGLDSRRLNPDERVFINNSTSEPQKPSQRVQGRAEPPAATDWQRECEKIRRDMETVLSEYQLLQDNYQIVVRRAQEQSKLLNIQNARIKHHMEVHHHVLDRVKTLETALADAMRKHQVERELRLAEVAQSEKISLSLHEAMKEIQTLNKQNSMTSRELMQKEKQRVDYQQKATAVRQRQQKVEYDRDDAVVQMISMRSEQLELSKQLEETRREAAEALLMREEDVDAPKLSAFSEMLSLSPAARLRKLSNYALTTKRVTAEASDRQLRHQEQRKSMYAGSINRVVRPADASMVRKASLTSSSGGQIGYNRSNRSANLMVVEGEVYDDDNDESMMEPPKEAELTGVGCYTLPPRGIDKYEIERTLRATFEGFDKSPDGNGVHVATIRRFFGDCGIVQPPLVPGDVDTILTRVLNQAQENRKRVIVRKDFTVASFPGSIGSSSGHHRATDAKRFRFFDEESFFEAVTLLVMRRFPRFDAKKALEVFITEYIHPMQRQQQQHLLIQQRRSSTGSAPGSTANCTGGPTRSGSMSATGTGNSSPTAACIGILKAVLNGLALHIGRDGEARLQEDPRFLTKQDGSSGTLLLASGHHSRKPKREDVVFSMLEMHGVLAREYKPLATICEFYSAMHHTPRDLLLKDETAMPLSFELLLTFAMDFEIIPSFMDRLSLKHLHSEVSGYLKTYLTLQKKLPPPHSMDTELLKKVAFSMVLARLAMELFSAKREYETPEKQATALLQWLDNSVGREKIQKKAMLPVVIKFSRKLYAIRA